MTTIITTPDRNDRGMVRVQAKLMLIEDELAKENIHNATVTARIDIEGLNRVMTIETVWRGFTNRTYAHPRKTDADLAWIIACGLKAAAKKAAA